jgi:speckle-type POZ protein
MADFCHRYTNDEPAQGCRNLTISCLVGPDDSLTVKCSFEFQVVANKTATAARARLLAQEQDMVVPPPSISWHLERLLETGVGSDVTFSLEDGEFQAHTLVVKERAPALLSKTWAEVVKSKKKDRKTMIWIKGIKAVVFKALLHLVYTDELPPLDDLVRAAGAGKPPSSSSRTRLAGDLLAAAERYQLVERMRPLCENLLCEAIMPENAAATLELARRHGRPELRAFCLDYMTSPGVFKAVVASEGYQALPADALRDIITQVAH